MFTKARRQAEILDVIQREPVRSQEQLRNRVRAVGFDVTQATLSRDIRELGLVKGGPEGAYQAPGQAASAPGATGTLQRALSEYLSKVDRVQQFVVLRTGPGQAQLLGVALDRARFDGVVGTLAGDDTILVIARSVAKARTLVQRLTALAGQGR
ncbi:MAG: arginine repressor [Vicinamibacterales bacterium]